MVKMIGINSDNDIFLDTSGNLTMRSDLAAVVDACQTAAQSQLGEMVLAQNSGIPNFQTIWVGSPNYNLFANYLTTTLQNVTGVINVGDLKISREEDIMNYVVNIETIYGNQTITLNG